METSILGLDVINLILIAFFISVSIIYWTTHIDKSEKFIKFIALISQLGIALLLSQFVLQNQKRHDEEKKEKAKNFLTSTERYTNNIENWFVAQYPYGVRLYKQMYPNHPGLEKVEVPANIDKNRQSAVEAHGCALLIQATEDAYRNENLGENYANPKYAGWMASCRKWFGSPILLKQWSYVKKNYGETYQNFVENELINKSIS